MSSTTSPEGGREERDPRKCEGTRKDGTPCPTWKVKGEKLCAGHLGRGVAASAEAARAAQRQSAEHRQEQASAAKRRAVDVYRDAVEQNAQEMVNARLAIIRDPQAPAADRLRAMEQLESRALGRPTERIETEPAVPEHVRVLEGMSKEERMEMWQRIRPSLRVVEEGDH